MSHLSEMAIEVKIKKWGNSLAVVLPKDFVVQKKLRVNKKVMIDVLEKVDLSDVFGFLKDKRKMSGQAFKDMVREGWEP